MHANMSHVRHRRGVSKQGRRANLFSKPIHRRISYGNQLRCLPQGIRTEYVQQPAPSRIGRECQEIAGDILLEPLPASRVPEADRGQPRYACRTRGYSRFCVYSDVAAPTLRGAVTHAPDASLGRCYPGGVSVVADAVYPGMYRVRMPDGTLTDKVNRARAWEAARMLSEQF